MFIIKSNGSIFIKTWTVNFLEKNHLFSGQEITTLTKRCFELHSIELTGALVNRKALLTCIRRDSLLFGGKSLKSRV